MKRNTLVAICHDGKWGRRVQGRVIETRRGHHVKVQFPFDCGDDEGIKIVEFWARVIPSVRHERRKKDGCVTMVSLKNYKHYGGWANIDWFCPWFAVYRWEKE